MSNLDPKLRIGRINYTNVWPIYYYFPELMNSSEVDIIEQVPTSLNQEMAAGNIDMGPISSFAYGESFENYMLYPDLSVSAYGEVNSILLFHEKPLREIANGHIVLPTTSATSVNLLKIILQKFYNGNPTYEYAKPDLEKMMEKADGALLIGDDAIKESWRNKTYMITDLGQEWAKWTGQWMSFAVWAIRRETTEKYPELVAAAFEAFMASKAKAHKNPEEMIREAQSTVGGTSQYWHHYFHTLCYDFASEQWEGLATYYKYCYELGFLPKPVSIGLWSEKMNARVTE
ncbi:menaquinone biosynthesis protein [Paenibacillus frigoriresistens]|uniref:menaquinone biosynthetic enzyme MqnA/MqnD family protein n=1 Tax=Paenibacillus alginolyticus TaxID=59839 RepID=UPI001567A252|nr:menaquinone biosynthesis protein [Paenibacillus frigoriresistens]NRF89707.1 menaquinone biosynthesis protein [Paenibacillus frigoriresistens]